MKWAALIVWVITALGGFGLLAIWLQRGGHRQSQEPGRRIRPPLIFTHLLLAATGLILWIIYVANDKKGFAWVAFALLLVVATLGFSMLALWLQRRSAAAGVSGQPPGPARRATTWSGLIPTDRPVVVSVNQASAMIDPRAAPTIVASTVVGSP